MYMTLQGMLEDDFFSLEETYCLYEAEYWEFNDELAVMPYDDGAWRPSDSWVAY